jgi:hypothetical protein
MKHKPKATDEEPDDEGHEIRNRKMNRKRSRRAIKTRKQAIGSRKRDHKQIKKRRTELGDEAGTRNRKMRNGRKERKRQIKTNNRSRRKSWMSTDLKETDSVMSAEQQTETAAQARRHVEDDGQLTTRNRERSPVRGQWGTKNYNRCNKKRKEKKEQTTCSKRKKESSTNSFQTTSVLKPSATKPRRARQQDSNSTSVFSMAGWKET